ncbi:dicarboxylate/amino acid:cation symporter [Clostridium sp.]|uniref:dicarboxylate/amino acid:cation symporter n=1 Tax=Clostridium sp. TaxID=1506 RepID=UPI0039924A56
MKFLKNYKFSLILLVSMILGSILGIIMGDKAKIFSPIADLFLNLLYCIVVPMIFVSLVSSIANMSDLKKLRKVLGVMMVVFVVTEIIATVYMIVVCIFIDPAKGAHISMGSTTVDMSSKANILSMFTVNDFSLLWSRKNIMALIVFSLLFGVSTVAVGEQGKSVVKFFNSLTEVITKMVNYIMYLAPIGLGAFFATLMGDYGKEIVGPLSKTLLLFFVASIVYFILSNTIFAFIGGGRKGLKVYWKNILPVTLTSLGTCSSAASIPSNLVACKKIGIPDDIKDITVPMGCNLHKDGACLTVVLKIAFVCSILDINFLSPKILITTILVSILSSTIIGAIPGGGYVGEILIVSLFGFPPATIPIMVLLGTITDAPATAINVTGDTGVAMIVSRLIEGRKWMSGRIKSEKITA